MELPQSTRYDAVVIGAGLIGLSCAWRARKRGLSVLVVDRARRGRRRHVGRGRRDARARHRGGLRRGGPAAGEPPGEGALARVRGRARGGHRPPDRLPRQRRAGRRRRPRRCRGAPPPARVPALARPRLRVAHAVGVPRARAGPVAADRRRDRRAAGRQRRSARNRARARHRGRGGRARRRGALDRARRLGGHRRADESGRRGVRPGRDRGGPLERLAGARSATARRCGP